jgi:hypothetical protein
MRKSSMMSVPSLLPIAVNENNILLWQSLMDVSSFGISQCHLHPLMVSTPVEVNRRLLYFIFDYFVQQGTKNDKRKNGPEAPKCLSCENKSAACSRSEYKQWIFSISFGSTKLLVEMGPKV